MKHIPTAAIVGRQNVGKSTLFNVLSETHKALVSPIAGTTRDRNMATVTWQGRFLRVIDTGGIEERPIDEIGKAVRQQAEVAIRTADVICFVVDGKAGLTEEDWAIGNLLRGSAKPVVLVINKLDGPRDRNRIPAEIDKLGFSEFVLLSAKNGTGTGDLLDILLHHLPSAPPVTEPQEIGLIFLGKPNVGKSSIVNRMLGEERVIVSSVPHTTRDPQDTELTYHGEHFRLIDTAGMRRQAKRMKNVRRDPRSALEALSVEKSLSALHRADIAAIVLDVTQPISRQDRTFFQKVEEAGVGVMLLANKWDLLPNKTPTTLREYTRSIRSDLPFLDWAPLLFVSAVTGQRIQDVLKQVAIIQAIRTTQITERSLERFLKHLIEKRKPPRSENTLTRLLSLSQIGTTPPHFRIMLGPRQSLPTAYQRFVIKELRAYYKLVGTAIRLTVEQRLRQ